MESPIEPEQTEKYRLLQKRIDERWMDDGRNADAPLTPDEISLLLGIYKKTLDKLKDM